MKRIFEFLKVDKWAHIFACILIVYVVADVDMNYWHRELAVATAMGACTAAFFSICKEVLEFFRGNGIDPQDLKADLIGIIIGAVLIVSKTLCC